MRSFLKQAKILDLAVFFCFTTPLLFAQGAEAPEPTSPTPSGMAPGSPAGSYALSGFDTVNLFAGHLNVQMPILSIGGRGEAGYTMTLPVPGSYYSLYETSAGPGYYAIWPSWTPYGPLTPGYLELRASSPSIKCPSGPGTGMLTNMVLVFADQNGTEHTLIDTVNYGAPYYSDCSGQPSPNRGSEFMAMDGSNIVFISNSAVSDVATVNGNTEYFGGAQNGHLYYPDGRSYEVLGGFITAIRDRNGNLVTLNYENQSTLGQYDDTNTHLLLNITDPLGRTANITWPTGNTGCTSISYQNKTYGFCQEYIAAGNVRPDLLAAGGGSLSGAQAVWLGGGGPGISIIELGVNSETGVTYQPTVIPQITLPNGESYSFLYTALGEVAQVTLPTGGAIQYDISWTPGVKNLEGQLVNMLGLDPNFTVYRRLTQRRTYQNASDSSPQQTISYSVQTTVTAPATTNSGITTSPTGYMVATVNYAGASGTVKTETHTFNSAPELQTGSNYTAGDGFPTWSDGLETLSQKFNPTNLTTPIGSTATNWVQPTLPTAITNLNAASTYFPQGHYSGFPPPYNPRVTQTSTAIDGITSAQVFCYDSTSFNNKTDVWEYGFGVTPSLGSNGCASTGSGYLRHRHTTYNTNTNYIAPPVQLLSLPQTQQVMDPNDNVIAETDYTYDGTAPLSMPAGPVTMHTSTITTSFPSFANYRGNVTGVTRKVSTSSSVSASATYDIAGNVHTATDANQNQTTFTYTDTAPWGAPSGGAVWAGAGPAGATYWYDGTQYTFGSTANTYAFPTKITNALSQSTTSTYAYNAGKPYQVTDPNGAQTTYNYADPLQRLTLVTYPVGSTDTYGYTDTPSSVSVSDTSSLNSCNTGNTVVSNVFYDGLGRQTSSTVQGPNGPITASTTYDALGRVYQVSNPYESGTPVVTTTTYDALNRPLTVTTPDGAVTASSYSGSGSYDQTIITDPAYNPKTPTNNERTLYTDALGHMVQVVAQTTGTSYSPSDYTTNYTYDMLDDLLTVASADTSQSSRNRSFTYDGLGRLTSATNPENGMVQYSSYDGNSNLLTKLANSITTTYTYDALNRLKTKNYSDGLTARVTYTYDGSQVPNSIGRLIQVSTGALGSLPATVVSYVQYDPNGRLTASQQTTNGQPYNFSYTYNAQSLEKEIYPSGRTVESCYDSAGRVSHLNNLTQTGLPSYATLSYTLPGGTVKTTATLGNGLVDTESTNTRLQTQSIQVGSLMSLGFNYGTTNNNGNLLSQTITRGSQTWVQSYAYDGLNRISCANENPTTAVTCAAGAGNWARTYGADPWANEWVASNTNSTLGLNSFTPTVPTNFNGSNQMTYQGATYDGAGNQTAIGGYTFVYDAESRMTSSTINGGSATYVYDGNGHRVMKTMGGATTTYVYDAMGQLVAEYGNPTAPDSGTKYISVDHLGSTRLVTDTSSPTPNQEICYDYLPFGEQIPGGTDGRTSSCFTSTATPLTQKFTGMEREGTEADNMDFFQARYMSAYQGRFTSPDPLGNFVADPTSPQSWNMYSYVWNNPLNSIDPTGTDTCLVDGFATDCNLAAQWAANGLAEACPNNMCTLATPNGFLFYRAYDNGVSGYAPLGALPVEPQEGAALTVLASNFVSVVTATMPGQPRISEVRSRRPPQQSQCLNSFFNSTLGQVTKFISPVSLLADFKNNWMDWTVIPGAKAAAVEATRAVSKDLGSTEFLSVTGSVASKSLPGAAAAGVEFLEPLAGALASEAIPPAAALDAGVRNMCASNPNLRF